MKLYYNQINKAIGFIMVCMFTVSFSFSFAQTRATRVLNGLFSNPEYKNEWAIIKQMRNEGISDDKILVKLEADAAKKIQDPYRKQQPVLKNYTKGELIAASGCGGGDIGVEQGSFGTWTAETRYWSTGGCLNTAWVPAPLPVANRITLVNAPSTPDPCADIPGFPIPLPCPNGGNVSIKLGNNQDQANSERIMYSFIVQQSDTNFIYNYAVVFENPSHLTPNQPYFDFVIIDAVTLDTIACSYQHYTADDSLVANGTFQQSNVSNANCSQSGSGGDCYYKPWTTVGVNLGAYVNKQVTVICTVADCSQCGHMGYAYVDFSCGTTAASQYCIGSDSVILVAPPMASATYLWETGSTNDSILVNPQIVDTMSVYVNPLGGPACGYYLNYILQPTVINPGFSVSVNCGTVSFTDTTQITGGTISGWQWSFPGGSPPSSTGQNPVVTYPPGAYTASLVVTSLANCKDTATTVLFTVPVMPTANAGPDTMVCTGSTNSVTICGSGTGSGISYLWQPIGSTTQCINVNPASGLTYTLIVTDANGCTSKDMVVAGQYPLPSVAISAPDTLCLGESATLGAISNPAGAAYTWTGAGLSCTNCPNPIATPGFSNVYGVTVTDVNGCTAAATTTVIVVGIPFVSAIASTTICPGYTAQLNANTSNGQGPYSYSWSPPFSLNNPNLQNPTATPITTTNYIVTVTDANGCTDDTTTTIFVGTEPSAAIAPWTPILTCEGYVIPMGTNGSSNATSFFWDFGDGSTSTIQNPVHSYPFNGTYSITLVVFNPPCRDSVDTTVVVGDMSSFVSLKPTNVFTPNADGFNDCFYPIFNGLSSDTLKQCMSMEIYDRWGIKLYESSGGTGTNVCWDGHTKSGTKAKEGTYYYIIKFGESTIKGYVTLLRTKN